MGLLTVEGADPGAGGKCDSRTSTSWRISRPAWSGFSPSSRVIEPCQTRIRDGFQMSMITWRDFSYIVFS